MEVIIYEGFQDTKYFELVKPLTEKNVSFTIGVPNVNELSKQVSIYLQIEMLSESLSDIDIGVFPIIANKPKTCFEIEVKADSIEKLEKIIKKRKEDFLKQLITIANKEIKKHIEHKNNEYINSNIIVYSGLTIQSDWIEDNLDDPKLNKQVKHIDDTIAKLHETRKLLEKERRKTRNKNMLHYVRTQHWEENGMRLPKLFLKQVVNMYEHNKAFSGGDWG